MEILILILAIIQVESRGNNFAIGDNGASHGSMQIQRGVVIDVNEMGFNYRWPEDCYDQNKSIEIFHLYMKRYATEKRLGRQPTWEDMARIWNGGPNGYKKEATLKYWEKIKKELNKSNL